MTLLRRLLDNLPNFEEGQIKFWRRTENGIADHLAKMAHPPFTIFNDYLPLEVRKMYEQEEQLEAEANSKERKTEEAGPSQQTMNL